MKKIFFFLSFLIGMMFCLQESAVAQKSPTAAYSTTNSLTLDTITNSTAHYFAIPKIETSYKKNVFVVATGIEISGTTDGLFTLEASGDSTYWYPFHQGTGMIDSTGGKLQLDLGDVTTSQSIRWVLPDFADLYLRVKMVGVGTTNFTGRVKYWWVKR